MSMSNVFYPGVFNPEQQNAITRSELWPLIAGIHFNSNGNLYLTKIGGGSNAYSPDAIMADRQGFPILYLGMICQNYYVFTITLPTECRTEVNIIESTNSRYVLSRLRGKMSSAIKNRLNYAEQTVLPDALDDATRLFVKTKLKVSNPNISMDSLNREAQEWALKVIYGKVALIEVPNEIRLMLDNGYKNYSGFDNSLAELETELREMFATDKWLMTYIEGYGYIAGKLRCDGLVSIAMEGAKNSWFPMWQDFQRHIVEPMRLYTTLDNMPDSLGRELKASLIMAKDGRGSDVKSRDPAKLIPAASGVQERIGAMSWRSQTDTYWIMVDA